MLELKGWFQILPQYSTVRYILVAVMILRNLSEVDRFISLVVSTRREEKRIRSSLEIIWAEYGFKDYAKKILVPS